MSSTFFKLTGFLVVMLALVGGFLILDQSKTGETLPLPVATVNLASNQVFLAEVPSEKILVNDYHVYQSFNNCAPAALSMTLSYYGINLSQEELMADLRPYNNPQGDNDNKSTPPPELAARAEAEGLVAYFRPAGDLELIKTLIANDFPVIVRTLLYPDRDYAHYRVIKGYGDGFIVQDDSLGGKNLKLTDEDFLKLWRPFNHAYLVLATPKQESLVEEILGENLDEKVAWQKAATRAERELVSNSSDPIGHFNLAVARYYLEDYAGAVAAFEAMEDKLTRHILWYQVEPIKAYFNLGQDKRVFELAEQILGDGNQAYVDLYLLRGRIYERRGQTDLARREFEQAVFYNVNSREAAVALASLEA